MGQKETEETTGQLTVWKGEKSPVLIEKVYVAYRNKIRELFTKFKKKNVINSVVFEAILGTSNL